MHRDIDELSTIQAELRAYAARLKSTDVDSLLQRVSNEATEVGKAWSGSFLGYHAKVYYADLQPPPPGAHFSQEWGLMDAAFQGTSGDWREYDWDSVRAEIDRRAGHPDLAAANDLREERVKLFERRKSDVLSILSRRLEKRHEAFLGKLEEEVGKLEPPATANQMVLVHLPTGGRMSRDVTALQQGLGVPPHLSALCEVASLRAPGTQCEALASLTERAVSHLERIERDRLRSERIGTNVFIGHGRAHAWRSLKDFVQERVKLPWDEFNRVPVAGITNVQRLSEMLDSASIAFLVLTGEDEMADGGLQARMNVIHEAGLFQGRLGFTRAVVLLEEGCKEFSNIEGLGQIRFPKDNIDACFEEVRRVLEREGLIEDS